MLARLIFALIIAALAAVACPAPIGAAESPCPSVLDHKFANLLDEPVSLCQFVARVKSLPLTLISSRNRRRLTCARRQTSTTGLSWPGVFSPCLVA